MRPTGMSNSGEIRVGFDKGVCDLLAALEERPGARKRNVARYSLSYTSDRRSKQKAVSIMVKSKCGAFLTFRATMVLEGVSSYRGAKH